MAKPLLIDSCSETTINADSHADIHQDLGGFWPYMIAGWWLVVGLCSFYFLVWDSESTWVHNATNQVLGDGVQSLRPSPSDVKNTALDVNDDEKPIGRNNN